MEIKNLPPTLAYIRKFETRLNELGNLVGSVPAELLEQATREGFRIKGPQFWNYTGMDGNPETSFQLEIAIPIETAQGIESEHVSSVPGFQCAAATVKGPWSNLANAYQKLVAEMTAQGLQPGMYCREVYHAVDFENPENNVTEILMSFN